MIQTIDGLALGGELTDVDVARLGLSHVSPGGETLPYWSDQDGLFTVYEDEGEIELISTLRDAPGLGEIRIGMPCEEVALLVQAPDAFESITGDWLYQSSDRELSLSFSDGHLCSLILRLL